MNLSELTPPKIVRTLLIVLLILISVLMVFALGEAAGYRKAELAGHFGDGYTRTFIGPNGEGGFPHDMSFSGGHGSSGSIVSIALPEFVIAEQGGTERTVRVSSTTDVRKFRDELRSDQLTVGDFVIVLGEPSDDGTIDSKLIRVMPSPDASSTSIRSPFSR